MGLGKSPGIGAALGAFGVGIGQGGQFEADRQLEYRAGVIERQGMGAAHEACADQADSEFAHSRGPLDYCFQGGY